MENKKTKNPEKLFKLKNGDYIKLSEVTGVSYMPLSSLKKGEQDTHYCIIERGSRSSSIIFDSEVDAKKYVNCMAENVQKTIKNILLV